MKSANGKTVTADLSPSPERGGEPVGMPPDPLAVCVELCRFLQQGLTDAQQALGQTLALQQTMMDVISHHVTHLDGGGDEGRSGPESEAMFALVTAMQSDDLMRQRHENLGQALSAMATAVREALEVAETDARMGQSAAGLRRRWVDTLLQTLTLDEMRQGFEQELGPASDPRERTGP